MTLKKSSVLALACVFAALGACSEDPVSTVDRTTDCADICSKYEECISSDYDVDDCTDRCVDMANDQQDERIDTCEDCLDEKSCVGSVFNCTAECAGIVP